MHPIERSRATNARRIQELKDELCELVDYLNIDESRSFVQLMDSYAEKKDAGEYVEFSQHLSSTLNKREYHSFSEASVLALNYDRKDGRTVEGKEHNKRCDDILRAVEVLKHHGFI